MIAFKSADYCFSLVNTYGIPLSGVYFKSMRVKKYILYRYCIINKKI